MEVMTQKCPIRRYVSMCCLADVQENHKGKLAFKYCALEYVLQYFEKVHFLAKYNSQLASGSVKVHIFMKILAMSLTGSFVSFFPHSSVLT